MTTTKTKKKTRIDITFIENDKFDDKPCKSILVYKNHVKELRIVGATLELYDYLANVLKRDNDFDSYLKLYGLQDAHLGTWLCNLLTVEDREILDMFNKVIVKFS